jgi:hypothetical protein
MHPSTQLERILKLIERLDAGEELALRDVRSLLPSQIKEEFEAARIQLKYVKRSSRQHPKLLTEYNVMLRTADLQRGRLKRVEQADSDKVHEAYGAALDVLHDWQQIERDIEHWFDRELDWDKITPTYDGVPRCKFLRRDMGAQKSIKSLKREYLQRAKDYIEQHHADELPKPMTEEQAAELKRRLALLMGRQR